ncbi:SDR family NAD(P)-dependent oxidoreductase [Aquirufa rosea]|uniref:SDR family NAD(P)-dependent oxidoreductase n=1 Tax=Aquirufa rosea TaxID=2509241 RepID=A0A4Q1C2X4_9BACT|nr:SDR family NAD(P)-dependent oxidoreductase [Aquirufa rosea]RXK52475.1 SDR family NAD(P)-dependent oxidoreductase [Aquirufa rosea]
MNKIACITGASSGIGWATSKALANLGYALILCGRRRERLEELQSSISSPTILLTFDVRNWSEVESAFSSLPNEWKNIDVLINNAGNAHGLSAIQDGALEDWDAMMLGNVNGLLYVSKMVIPEMIRRQMGHIINLSSIAGKQTYANGNVYCASKAAVEALSQGMRIDLNTFNIKVSNIAPGAVNTEFSSVRFKGDMERANSVYQGFTPLVAEDVADLIAYIVSCPSHVNIADVTILPTAQASATQIKKDL